MNNNEILEFENANEINILYPPSPPSNNLKNYSNMFSYVKNIIERQMLQNAFEAIDLCELWHFIKKDPGHNRFMGLVDPELDILTNKMSELKNSVDHSGFSMTWTLRAMQFLANYGEKQFKISYYEKN